MRGSATLSHAWGAVIPLAFDPHLTIGEELLFPDRDEAFEPVDPFERSIERWTAMRRSGKDRNAGFADLHAAQAMDHRDAADGKLSGDFASNVRHFADC